MKQGRTHNSSDDKRNSICFPGKICQREMHDKCRSLESDIGCQKEAGRDWRTEQRLTKRWKKLSEGWKKPETKTSYVNTHTTDA